MDCIAYPLASAYARELVERERLAGGAEGLWSGLSGAGGREKREPMEGAQGARGREGRARKEMERVCRSLSLSLRGEERLAERCSQVVHENEAKHAQTQPYAHPPQPVLPELHCACRRAADS